MSLGKRIWRLWQLRRWVAIVIVVALVAATWSVAKISLLPPKLSPRSLEMATATTHVIVDTPTSSVLDLREDTGSFQAMTQRAILLGNVIANGAVRQAIRSTRSHTGGFFTDRTAAHAGRTDSPTGCVQQQREFDRKVDE